MKNKFVPIIIPYMDPVSDTKTNPLTVTTILYSDVAKEFEDMVEKSNCSRSFLLRQMVFYCLGKRELLNNLKIKTSVK